MAVTENSYIGNGSTTNYSFTFPYLKSTDVQVQVDAAVTTAWTFANATTVQFNTAPSNGAKIKILRDTNVDSLAATFYAGSSIKSEDLNDNYTQNLYKTQEVGARYFSNTGGTMTGDLTLGEDVELIFEGATDDDHQTKLTVVDPTADQTYRIPNLSAGTYDLVSTGDTGTVARAMIANDAVDGTKIADDSINSEHYVDGSIDLAHLSANSVNSSKIVDGSIVAADLATDAVSTIKIANDAVTADKLANTSVTAGTYTATDLTVDAQGRITAASNGVIAGSEIAADAIDGTKIADDAVDSEHLAADSIDTEHYAAGSVDTTALGADAVTGAKIADDSVDSEHIVADSLDTEHYAPTSINADALASNAVTENKITDSSVSENKIANNAVTIGKIGCEQTTISNSDSHIPTSGAVVDYVAAQIAPIGGLEVIADEDNFPTSQPGAGVVISISDAAGIVVQDGSGGTTAGRSTTARTAGNGSDNVTINNFPSSLHGETLASGVGLMVSSTGSSNTYNYHKILAAETDVKQLSDDINDFNARYRVNAGEPGSDNNAGDLVFDTNANKMKVYDGSTSSWGEVTSTGDFKYLFLCPAGGSGAPTLNGSIATYDLREGSNSGSAASVTSAAQLVVSVNGVVQKANTGTSAPAEGFALVDANTIVFGANLASGDSVFIVQIGSAVSIPTPGDGTVNAAKIASGAVETAKIADGAVTEVKLGISNAGSDGQFLSKQSGNTGGLTWATVSTDSDKIFEGSAKVEVKRTSDSPAAGDHTDEVEFTVSKTDASNNSNNLTHIAGTVDGHGRWFIGPQSGGKSSAPDHLTDGSSLTISGSYDRTDNVTGSYNSYACLHLNNASPQSASALGKIYFSGYGNGFEGGSIIGIPTGAWGNYPNYRATDITVNLNGYGVNSSTSTDLVERWRFKASGALAVNGISNIGTAGQVLTSAGDAPPTWEDGASTVAGGAIYENSQTISANHTIPSGSNGMSAGPVTVNNNITLTISNGSTYTIV